MPRVSALALTLTLLLHASRARAQDVAFRDSFGYAALPAAFAFENITNTGTRVLINTDNSSVSAALGFAFTFYGRTYQDVSFSPNGLITLGGEPPWDENVNLTNDALLGYNFPIIAVLWDRWSTRTNLVNAGVDAVYYQTLGVPGDRRFIVQWNNIFGYWGSPSAVTFQAILFESNGQILCQYLDVDSGNYLSSGGRSTVGIRDTDGHLNGKNRQWSFNQPVITNGQAILFTTVPTDPTITAHPPSRTNVAGTTASFTVVATGSGTLGYKWQRNGVTLPDGGNVSGATTATLTLTNVVGGDSANYTVAVTNAAGRVVSAVATLTAVAPPVIVTQPQNRTNVVNSSVTFSVTASGSDPKSYQWRTNGVPIPGATGTSTTAANLQLGDSGLSFTVVITNLGGSVTSAPAILTVRLPQTLIVTTTNDSGAGSLRQLAILDSVPGDSITFASYLSGQTILLTNGRIVLNKNLTIDGSALANAVQLNGNHASEIFSVNSGTTIVLISLTIANGYYYGGIDNGGTLTVNNCTLTNNSRFNFGFADRSGGGIGNRGTLTVNNSTLVGNSCIGGWGGGIYNAGTLTVNNSTLANNLAVGSSGSGYSIDNPGFGGPGGPGHDGLGGGIYNAGTLMVNNSTLANNSGRGGRGGSGCCGSGVVWGGGGVGLGGGIYNTATLNLTNSIVCSNTASSGGQNIRNLGTENRGTSLVDTNALLAPLAYNGGPTPTMALLPGSPARDAAVAGLRTSDQRGYPIVGVPDIGAYEAGTLTLNFNAWIWETLPATATTPQHAAGFDYDNDGASNYDEWLAMTDPTNALSGFRTLSIQRTNATNYLIRFPTVAGRNYTLWSATTLTNAFTDTGLPAQPGTGVPRTFTNTVGTNVAQRFYKVQAGP